MPEKNKVIEFKNHSHKFPVPFVVYADFLRNVLQNYFKHASLLLVNLIRIHIKNMNLQDSVCISKDLMELEKTFKPIIYTKQKDDEDILKVFVTKLKQIVK